MEQEWKKWAKESQSGTKKLYAPLKQQTVSKIYIIKKKSVNGLEAILNHNLYFTWHISVYQKIQIFYRIAANFVSTRHFTKTETAKFKYKQTFFYHNAILEISPDKG